MKVPLGTELVGDVAAQRVVSGVRIKREQDREVPFDIEGVRVAADHRQPQDQLAERTLDGFDLEVGRAHEKSGRLYQDEVARGRPRN